MEIIRLSSVDHNAWDQRGLQAAGANIFQLSSFLNRPLVTLDHFHPIYLVMKDREKIIAQLLLTEGSEITRLFADFHGFLLIRPFLNKFFKSYRFAYGPLIFDRSRYYEILEFFVKYLDQNILSKGIHVRNITPPLHDRDVDQEKIRSIFETYGFSANRWGTFVTNVDQSEENLWSSIGKESRSKVRKARQAGITITEVEDEKMLGHYYQMSIELSKRNQVSTKSWNAFLHSLRDPHTKIFLSMHKGIPVSGQMAMCAGNIILLGAVTTSNYAVQEKIYGNDLMQWHMLGWAKAHGFSMVDSVGVQPNIGQQTTKESGIYRLKKRWGGELLNYYTFEKTYKPFTQEFLAKSKIFLLRFNSILSDFNKKIKAYRGFVGPTDRILSASSEDGLNFTRDDSICIESHSTLRPEMLYFPSVNRLANGQYRMYFHSSRKTKGSWNGEIYSALSTNGIHWTRESALCINNPLVKYEHVQSPHFLNYRSQKMLYFCGRTKGGPYSPFVAYTNDGRSFFDPISLDLNFNYAISDFCIFEFENFLRMYFSKENNIGSAISEKGKRWKLEEEYRLRPGARGLKKLVNNPSVVQLEDGRFRMYFRGSNKNAFNSRIFSAISDDGLQFTLEGGTRMDYSGKYELHGVGFPNVVKFDTHWKMYYAGYWGKHLIQPLTILRWS
ncbi:MAG: hypothetical protein VX294_13105 [Candidatus Latescibacterota bacterium]|nr:hypothetical protein [Candidatus Latescibacterota bacterium]